MRDIKVRLKLPILFPLPNALSEITRRVRPRCFSNTRPAQNLFISQYIVPFEGSETPRNRLLNSTTLFIRLLPSIWFHNKIPPYYSVQYLMATRKSNNLRLSGAYHKTGLFVVLLDVRAGPLDYAR